mmetsp:Transcript_26299/g.71466  ORF Transcript_26299/g.71466 Transcript_26299/m.71466 type:complete len:392 (+) Transcript_26299:393-1568(+)
MAELLSQLFGLGSALLGTLQSVAELVLSDGWQCSVKAVPSADIGDGPRGDKLVRKDWRHHRGETCSQCRVSGPSATMVHDDAALGKEPLMRRGRDEADLLRSKFCQRFRALHQPLPQRVKLRPATQDNTAAASSLENPQSQVQHGTRRQALDDHGAPAHRHWWRPRLQELPEGRKCTVGLEVGGLRLRAEEPAGSPVQAVRLRQWCRVQDRGQSEELRARRLNVQLLLEELKRLPLQPHLHRWDACIVLVAQTRPAGSSSADQRIWLKLLQCVLGRHAGARVCLQPCLTVRPALAHALLDRAADAAEALEHRSGVSENRHRVNSLVQGEANEVCVGEHADCVVVLLCQALSQSEQGNQVPIGTVCQDGDTKAGRMGPGWCTCVSLGSACKR